MTSLPNLSQWGVSARNYLGEKDLPGMYEVVMASMTADGLEEYETFEDFKAGYEHLVRCDPEKDILIVENDGRVIGYTRVYWNDVKEGYLRYQHLSNLLPEWRKDGLRKRMLEWNEERIKDIATSHDPEREKKMSVWAMEESSENEIYKEMGYRPMRYFYEMLAPLDDVKQVVPPKNVWIRPTKENELKKVFDAENEAFKDHWGVPDEDDPYYRLEERMEKKYFSPEMWLSAWDNDEVAGEILLIVSEDENRIFNRKWGWVASLSVRREWRNKRVAKALMSRGLSLLKEKGMEHAGLGVDSSNPTGALQLYESFGFRPHKKSIAYSKPLILS